MDTNGRILLLLLVATVASRDSFCWPSLPGSKRAGTGVLLQGLDVLALPGEEVELVARLEKHLGPGHQRPIVDKKVLFFLDGKRLGYARTNDAGRAVLRYRTGQPGAYAIRATTSRRGTGTDRSSPILVKVVDRRTPVILTDIEMTLHNSSSLRFPFTPNKDLGPLPDSVDALRRFSELRCLVYLSSGDGSSAWKIRDWLDRQDYPPGPVLHLDLPADPEAAAKQKSEQIRHLSSRFSNIVAGIGNREADAVACQENRIASFLVTPDPETGYPTGTQVYASWKRLLGSVSSRWREISVPGERLQP